MNAPTVNELAQLIADHYDADLGLADETDPGPSDIALAQKIRDRIDTATYFNHLSDLHGYHHLAARIGVGALAAIVIAVLIVIFI